MSDPPETPKPFVMKDTTVRDAAIAIVAGLLVLVFVIYGISTMSKTVGGDWISGTIVEKVFRPDPDTQISFGAQGLKKREVPGDYLFKVHVKDANRTYSVWVDEPTFRSYETGDRFKFPRPADGSE